MTKGKVSVLKKLSLSDFRITRLVPSKIVVVLREGSQVELALNELPNLIDFRGMQIPENLVKEVHVYL